MKMKINIDGIKDIISYQNEEESVGSILKNIQRFVASEKRVVLDVRVDKKPINEITPESEIILKKAASQFKAMDLTTCLKSQLSYLSLEEIKEDMPSLKEKFSFIAVKVQERNLKTALEKFIELIDQWKVIHERIIDTLSFMEINLSKTKFKNKSLQQFLEEHNQVYKELLSAMEQEDWVLVADFMEYEIPPKFDEILDLCTDMMNQSSDQTKNAEKSKKPSEKKLIKKETAPKATTKTAKKKS